MPIKSCTLSGGGSGYKFGDSGHCYASREQAIKQMKAEYFNGYKGKGATQEEIDDVVSSLSDDEFNALIGDSEISFMTRATLAQAKKKNPPIPKDSKTGKSQLPNAAGPF
jgi:hypothetical protein